MYEYESKEITSYKELMEIYRKATAYFIGSFTMEIIKRREEWENPATKTAFIESFHKEYFAWDENWSISRTRNRVNCVIRIIKSHRVEEALELVINSDDMKMGIIEAKINAQATLEYIKSGKLIY